MELESLLRKLLSENPEVYEKVKVWVKEVQEAQKAGDMRRAQKVIGLILKEARGAKSVKSG